MKIQTISGKFDDGCTTSNNLTENQIKKPELRDIIHYAEPRQLSTLIVSGVAKSERAMGFVKTKIGRVPDSKLIGDHGYRYKVMGRIQEASVIVEQVGTSGSDGSFTLRMQDDLLYPGMVALFHSELLARVVDVPTGGNGSFVYRFKSVDGTVFNFATDVAPQSGEKTCFGSYTAYGEGSLRGYDRNTYPDEFINHLTIQRKSTKLTGSALTDILWYKYGEAQGWVYEAEAQARLRFNIENEYQKWFGRSSMKDANGRLLETSRHIDNEGNEVVMGDGIRPQIEDGNVLEGSGQDGRPTLSDFRDMMTMLEKKSDVYSGKVWYAVTGTDGWNHAQALLEERSSQVFNHTVNQNSSMKPGGPEVEVGYNFSVYNVNGNQLIFVKHPLFDDEQRFTKRASDGTTLQSSEYIILDMAEYQGRPNIEILAKGARGIDRRMITQYLGGMTGTSRNVVTSVDADSIHMLKEDGIFVYNTTTCGIMKRAEV